jgi:23S rRNA pseudouridine955/2504/2580 synthase/23S rRNA pseudouridine1911/1915/1917 synthase
MNSLQNQPQIIFEDEHFLILNKPSGMPVSPVDKAQNKLSLCEWVHNEIDPKFNNVCRIDADTSGIVIFAKNKEAFSKLTTQFEKQEANKIYIAFVAGMPPFDQLTINMPLEKDPQFQLKMRVVKNGGKKAITRITVKEKFRKFALIEAEPLTGRTHQIRVHLSATGYPIVGDNLYGMSKLPFLSKIKRNYKASRHRPERPLIDRLALHSYSITLHHPCSGEQITFKAELPEDFRVLLKYMRKFAAT